MIDLETALRYAQTPGSPLESQVNDLIRAFGQGFNIPEAMWRPGLEAGLASFGRGSPIVSQLRERLTGAAQPRGQVTPTSEPPIDPIFENLLRGSQINAGQATMPTPRSFDQGLSPERQDLLQRLGFTQETGTKGEPLFRNFMPQSGVVFQESQRPYDGSGAGQGPTLTKIMELAQAFKAAGIPPQHAEQLIEMATGGGLSSSMTATKQDRDARIAETTRAHKEREAETKEARTARESRLGQQTIAANVSRVQGMKDRLVQQMDWLTRYLDVLPTEQAQFMAEQFNVQLQSAQGAAKTLGDRKQYEGTWPSPVTVGGGGPFSGTYLAPKPRALGQAGGARKALEAQDNISTATSPQATAPATTGGALRPVVNKKTGQRMGLLPGAAFPAGWE